MDIFGKYVRSLQDFVGGQQLLLSGELVISSKQNTQLLRMSDDAHALVDKIVNVMATEFPFLQIEKGENVVELSIKFFAYNRFIADAQFLEHFRSCAADAVQTINSSEELTSRFAANGTLTDSSKKQKFLYLSKATMVEYKVTESEKVNILGPVTRHRLMVYGLALLFAVLIIYNLYYLYAYVPDHNPSRLLTKVIDV